MSDIHRFWIAVAVHLWQTTLVLVPLFLAGWALRGAPATVRNRLWSLGLMKLFLPLSVLGAVGHGLLERVAGTGDAAVPVLSPLVANAGAWLDPQIAGSGTAGTAPPVWFFIAATLLWLAGVSWLLTLWIPQLRRQRRVRGLPLAAAGDDVRRRARQALATTRIPEAAVRISAGDHMPSVAGLLRPRIVVPEMLVHDLPAAGLRGVLLHEDAHRRRLDPLRDLVHRVAMITFFFYPPLWPLLRNLRVTCEMACDEAAVKREESPLDYRAALARTLTLGLRASGLPAANSRGDTMLVRRFRHLDRHGRFRTMPRHRVVLGMCVVMLLVASFLPLSPAADETSKERSVTIGEVLETVRPGYPPDARRVGVEGHVRLRALIGKDGTPGKIRVEQDVEGFPSFADSCIAALEQWRFAPPMDHDGEPAEMEVIVPFEFKLDPDGDKEE